MTGKSGNSTKVRFEGESGVNSGRGRDDLVVISDVFIF